MPSKKETPLGRIKTAKKAPVKATKAALKKPKNEPLQTIKIIKATTKRIPQKKLLPAKKPTTTKAPEKEVVLNNLNVLLMEKRKAAKGGKAGVAGDESAITLPPSISLRAKQKAGIFFSEITHDFEHSAMRISYTAAFCFMLLGTILAMSGSGALALLTFDGSIVEESLQSQMAAPLSNGPLLTIFEQVPEVISEVSLHTFSFTNTTDIRALLISRDEGSVFPLEVFSSSDDIYQISIDPTLYSPSTYELKISGRAKDSEFLYTKTAAQFNIEFFSADIATSSDTEEDRSVIENEETVEENEEEIKVTDESNQEPVRSQDELVSISIPNSTVTGSKRLVLQAPELVSTIEIWLRPIKTSQLLYLGTAKRSTDNFSFIFDTTSVPDGDYVLIGKTRHDNVYVEVETQKFSVVNVLTSGKTESRVLGEATTTPSERTFADVGGVEQVASTSSYTDESVLNVISEYQTELRAVFERYAVAVQAKDTVLIALAKARIEDVKVKIMRDVLQSDVYNERANAIELGLTKYFDANMKRTDSFEEVRQIASPDSWKDSDSDGVSDIDETALYGSDPTVVDTDNDGVLDGVEIIQGYNPLVADLNTPISYESPLNSLAPADTLSLGITAVLPVIEYKETGEVRSTEIKGWSYPNSFVTIYLFSKPLVTKAKTDENGHFSLILDKELDNGEHEVYAAITDNEGAIVLQSNAFRFVKDGEQLLALADGASLPFMQATVVTPKTVTPSNVVAGVGILALGLILLMLSISLRRREQKALPTKV